VSGRVAIVTGAASGIGRATVERLLEAGASVVALDRDAAHLAWVTDDGRSDRLAAVVGDVTAQETNDAAVAAALERFGRLDAAVFNAGVSMSGGLLDLPIEEFDRSIAVNVRAVALGMRSVVETMRAAGGGRIVVTASTSGIGGDPNLWAYNAAKGAVINLVRAAAVELGADDITVNAVCPGPTETAMTERLQSLPDLHEDLRRTIPLQRWGRPSEIAAVIAFLTSAEASFITGAIVPVDGGITANTGQFRPRERLLP
jgi:meso-butanediol dehydrogenase / (S,S)-butanediol dehydrogenase / diacetyl reductase